MSFGMAAMSTSIPPIPLFGNRNRRERVRVFSSAKRRSRTLRCDKDADAEFDGETRLVVKSRFGGVVLGRDDR
jgi:hypothetical protein